MTGLSVADFLRSDVVRSRPEYELLNMKGIYRVEHFRNGELIGRTESKNTITTEGKRYLLSAGLLALADKSAWYVGLIDNNSAHDTPGPTLVYDTFFDGVNNTELVNYTGTAGQRKVWTKVLDVGGLPKITNTVSKAAFEFTSGAVAYGAALVSNINQSNHVVGDYLMSYAAFTGGPITVIATDVINVEIELSFT